MPNKRQLTVRATLQDLRRVFPFPIRGIDCDNGSEFLNETCSPTVAFSGYGKICLRGVRSAVHSEAAPRAPGPSQRSSLTLTHH